MFALRKSRVCWVSGQGHNDWRTWGSSRKGNEDCFSLNREEIGIAFTLHTCLLKVTWYFCVLFSTLKAYLILISVWIVLKLEMIKRKSSRASFLGDPGTAGARVAAMFLVLKAITWNVGNNIIKRCLCLSQKTCSLVFAPVVMRATIFQHLLSAYCSTYKALF